MPNPHHTAVRQVPLTPLIGAYLDAQRNWSDAVRHQNMLRLNRLARYLSEVRGTTLEDATRADCDAYVNQRMRDVSAATAHQDWMRARAFYRWAVDNGDVESPRHNDYGPMNKVEAPEPGEPDPDRTRVLPEEVYEALMANLDKRSLTDCRDGAIYSLMYRTGLRAIEVCRIDVERLHRDATIPTVEVLGKGKRGGKWRTVPVAAETMLWIDRYLRRLGSAAPREGHLFISSWNGHANSGGRIKPCTIHASLERHSRQIGLDRPARSHQFRRASATNARDRGINDQDIIEVHGWEGDRMLRWYTKQRKAEQAVAAFAAADPTRGAAPAGAVRRAAHKAPPRRNLRAVS